MFNELIGEKALRYFVPFKYYDSLYIMVHASYEIPFVILGFIIVASSILASYVIYGKKDFLL